MQCPNCGLKYGNNEKSCPKCGLDPTKPFPNHKAFQVNAAGCFSVVYGLGMLGGAICAIGALGAAAFNLRGMIDPLMKVLFFSGAAIAIGKIGLELKKK